MVEWYLIQLCFCSMVLRQFTKYEKYIFKPNFNNNVNQHNAFEQLYKSSIYKVHPNSDLIFVDNYMFTNGSMYKGYILVCKDL